MRLVRRCCLRSSCLRNVTIPKSEESLTVCLLDKHVRRGDALHALFVWAADPKLAAFPLLLTLLSLSMDEMQVADAIALSSDQEQQLALSHRQVNTFTAPVPVMLTHHPLASRMHLYCHGGNLLNFKNPYRSFMPKG